MPILYLAMVVDVLNSYSLVVREESILLQGQPCSAEFNHSGLARDDPKRIL